MESPDLGNPSLQEAEAPVDSQVSGMPLPIFITREMGTDMFSNAGHAQEKEWVSPPTGVTKVQREEHTQNSHAHSVC